jgi:predicted RNA-binding Zn-ribbon protein involved in translation (DUF1610 family)
MIRKKRLRRILFNAVSAFSLLLCVASIATWLTGGWADYHPAGPNRTKFMGGWHRWYCFGDTFDGEMLELEVLHLSAKPEAPSLKNLPDSIDVHRLGFDIHLGPFIRESPLGVRQVAGTRMSLEAPYLRLAVLTFILPAAAILLQVGRRFRRRTSRHACPNCGYDLRATPNRCPECGTVADAAIARAQPAETSASASVVRSI